MANNDSLPDVTQSTHAQGGISIASGSQVSLHFSLALTNGELIDSNFDSSPATFRLGDGSMLPGFEAALIGLQAGAEIEVLLEPVCAFGGINPGNRHRFPIAKFENLLEDELLPTSIGSVVSFKDAAGFDLPGVVTEISDVAVVVDFNHPLAGKAIRFRAAIIAVLPPDVVTVEIKL